MASIQLYVDGTKVYDNGQPLDGAAFIAAVQAAWAADTTLNWTGGDVTINSPIVLDQFSNKLGFGIRFNGATIKCNFNDASKHAITIRMGASAAGTMVYNVVGRNWKFVDGQFTSVTPYAGPVKFECLTNQSWIGTMYIKNMSADGFTDYAWKFVGGIFEFVMDTINTTNGKGGFYASYEGLNNTVVDAGLPSAMYLYNPDFRDFTECGIKLTSPNQYNEPFDLTVVNGYIVTGDGAGIWAPAGISSVQGVGFENLGRVQNTLGAGSAMQIGYRGGVIQRCRGANPVPSSSEASHLGMEFLVNAGLSNNPVVLEDCLIQNETSGTNAKLANVFGSGGTIYLNRSGPSSGVTYDNTQNTLINTTP